MGTLPTQDLISPSGTKDRIDLEMAKPLQPKFGCKNYHFYASFSLEYQFPTTKVKFRDKDQSQIGFLYNKRAYRIII